jgi:hypothetical protein
VFRWSRSNKNRKKIREDRRYLKERARRLLQDYLVADEKKKQKYYEAIAGAAAACRPNVLNPSMEDPQLARSSAEAALKVVKLRDRLHNENDDAAILITDAYATVAIAFHRAATVYMADQEMQKLGTAAVHLTTIALSYIASSQDKLLR